LPSINAKSEATDELRAQVARVAMFKTLHDVVAFCVMPEEST